MVGSSLPYGIVSNPPKPAPDSEKRWNSPPGRICTLTSVPRRVSSVASIRSGATRRLWRRPMSRARRSASARSNAAGRSSERASSPVGGAASGVGTATDGILMLRAASSTLSATFETTLNATQPAISSAIQRKRIRGLRRGGRWNRTGAGGALAGGRDRGGAPAGGPPTGAGARSGRAERIPGGHRCGRRRRRRRGRVRAPARRSSRCASRRGCPRRSRGRTRRTRARADPTGARASASSQRRRVDRAA